MKSFHFLILILNYSLTVIIVALLLSLAMCSCSMLGLFRRRSETTHTILDRSIKHEFGFTFGISLILLVEVFSKVGLFLELLEKSFGINFAYESNKADKFHFMKQPNVINIINAAKYMTFIFIIFF